MRAYFENYPRFLFIVIILNEALAFDLDAFPLQEQNSKVDRMNSDISTAIKDFDKQINKLEPQLDRQRDLIDGKYSATRKSLKFSISSLMELIGRYL